MSPRHYFNGIVRSVEGLDRNVRFEMPTATAVRRAVERCGYKLISVSKRNNTFVPAPPPYRKPMTSFVLATGIAGAVIGLGAFLGFIAGVSNFMGMAPEMGTGERWWMLLFSTIVIAGMTAVTVIPTWLWTLGAIGLVELAHAWGRKMVEDANPQ